MFNFDNSYARLPQRFFEKVNPSKVPRPELIKFNHALATELNLQDLDSGFALEIFSGNKIAEGSEPLAQAYAGHQFGHFVPKLGDGRAILLGEVIDKSGLRRDIQLKGAGRTSFSRSGDGRAWLGPVIREYIVSEAMHALGVPTTRSLAAVLTGEDIYRESRLPGAILTRVAASHIRIGTFEYFAARKDTEALSLLTDYVIDRHYPEIKESSNRYKALLEKLVEKQAFLVAKWMSIGFVHGVMNTDNMSISGETIDYGPCAFMDFYDTQTVFSSIDHYGRYAYDNQANIAMWNLSCLANTLLPLIDEDQKTAIAICSEVLESFKTEFENNFSSLMLEKIGFTEFTKPDSELVLELLDLMHKYKADFTLSFRYLADLVLENPESSKFFALFDEPQQSNPELSAWLEKWRFRIKDLDLNSESVSLRMNEVNPAFIPRNHRIEEAIKAAHLNSDFSYMNKLVQVLSNPYKDQEEFYEYSLAPENKKQDYVTFCGT